MYIYLCIYVYLNLLNLLKYHIHYTDVFHFMPIFISDSRGHETIYQPNLGCSSQGQTNTVIQFMLTTAQLNKPPIYIQFFLI